MGCEVCEGPPILVVGPDGEAVVALLEVNSGVGGVKVSHRRSSGRRSWGRVLVHRCPATIRQLTALSDASILFKELLAHQLHQLLVGDVVDQAKTFPEAPLVFL